MESLDQTTTLFSKPLLVVLKENGQRKVTLDVCVQTKISSIRHRKELFIQLTNPDDLFFLQTLSLGEEDFQSLKNQQGLLVDFNAFGQKFIDLLDMCIKEEKSVSPRFMLQFTCNNGSLSSACFGMLEVVEINPFKHLIHLSLKFVAGNDEEVKKYLVSCLKVLKEEKSNLVCHSTNTENDLSTKLSSAEKLLSDQTKELNELREKFRCQFEENTMFYQNELSKEKQAFLQLQETSEGQLNINRRNLEDQYNKKIQDLECRWRECQSSNKDLTDQKYRYESLIRELKSKISSLEQERSLTTRDVQTLRRQNTNLDSDRHERDKTLNHLRTRVAVLEQELKDKEQVIQRSNELINTSNEQKSRLELDLEHRIHQSNQFEENVKTLSGEVRKGNEIIQKLQGELKSSKSRIKMLNIVTTKQERLVEEKDIILAQKEKELTKQKDDISVLNKNLKEENEKREDLSVKVTEFQEAMKNNENVINWLNKQLNEQSINRLSSTHNITANNTAPARISYPQQRPAMNLTNYGVNPRAPMGNYRPAATSPLITNPYGLPEQPLNQTSVVNSQMGNNGYSLRSNQQQVLYRPILKKPQFQPDGISPIVPMTTKQPLRQKQLHISTPACNPDPVLDPKYLMRKRPEPSEDKRNTKENDEPLHNDKIRTVKPFPLSTGGHVVK